MILTLDGFKNYMRNVGKLYSLTSQFIEYYNNIIGEASNKFVEDVSEELRNMILGGLKSDGKYVENAYGLFIEDFIGLKIEDPKLYVSKLRLGQKPNIRITTRKTPFIEFIEKIYRVSKFLINRARQLDLDTVLVKQENNANKNIEKLITDIIRTTYELSVGINDFSTSVWGLRKITPHFMKKAYENVSEDLLKILGFSKLINIKDYELWGFPDYFTKCELHDTLSQGGGAPIITVNGVPIISRLNIVKEYLDRYHLDPVSPRTIGGAVCTLNEIIWRYNKLLKDILSRWLEGYIDLENVYLEKAWGSLNDIGWRIPEYLHKEKIYTEFEKVLEGIIGSSYGSPFKFLIDEDGVITKYRQWTHRGSYSNSGFTEYKLQHYILLPELFDDLMPAIYLGIFDTTFYLNNEKALLLLIRTQGGG